jgi:hypothetical protein
VHGLNKYTLNLQCINVIFPACPLSVVVFFFLSPSQPLREVLRIWFPAVACPQCSYPNDQSFGFCQRCGYVRHIWSPPPQGEILEIDIESINARIGALSAKQTYDRQKSRLLSQLCQFFASLPIPKDVMSASPHDLVRFLVWKNKTR